MRTFSKPAHRREALIGMATCLAVGSCALSIGQPSVPTTYRNPVIPGDFPDPTVIRVGSTYYAAGTSSEWAPHYPLFVSEDLVHWEQIGHVFGERPDWTVSSFWAPELFHHNDTFYVYYTARRKADGESMIGVATSKDPRKGFTDHGVVVEWGNEAIDAFVFADTNGTLHITWKAYGLDPAKPITIMGSELSDDGLSLRGEAFEMIQADPEGWDWGGIEGQAIVRRDGFYYMFLSGRGCCGPGCSYAVGVARAREVRGPWEIHEGNPILEGDLTWRCPGHGTPVTTPDGRLFYLYHAYSGSDWVYTGRQGLLDEIRWGADGWPYFAYGLHPTAQAPAPFPNGKGQPPPDIAEDFEPAALGPQWVWDFRNPPIVRFADGALQLAAERDLAFLGVRAGSGNYVVETELEIPERGFAGLAAYGDAQHLVAGGVRSGELAVWQTSDAGHSEVASRPINLNGPIHLRLSVTTGDRYRFEWSADGKDWHPITSAGGRRGAINAQIAPWDRGVRAGMFVQTSEDHPARFRSFQLRHVGR